MAQSVGQITIGGKVFGGGLQGKIGTANAENTLDASIVTIKDGDLSDVYGGGEMGDSKGKTNVILQGGTVSGSVFGGARMADIDGQTHVLIDGENATNDLVVKNVFGGNDISGNVNGTALVESTLGNPETYKIYVTNLFGGGNGDYDYASNKVDGVEQNPYAGRSKPEIANVEIDLRSGCYFQVFGGGNAATVTESTTIGLNNSTTNLVDAAGNTLTYQFERVFGGNNKEPMAIRPTWDLQKASVNNLYSGGNAGAMTFYDDQTDKSNPKGGIILAIKSPDMEVNNVYGGCRMADVNPGGFNGSAAHAISAEAFSGHLFQTGYAARVLITDGVINNVYGGNDVSGNVYYGSQVEILSSINGDVYGAGNGSYPYTDQESWVEAHPEDADYYYDPSAAASSVEALNNWRPNVEKSWVHVKGKGVSEPTVIGGSLYCGGNSATLRSTSGDLTTAKAHLQIGSDVIADQVFQGSNGVNMISEAMLQKYADSDFSSLDLTDPTTFDKYMEGVEVAIRPEVEFDQAGKYGETEDYADYSARFGSLYCGGNVGSMSADGLFTISFLNSLVIYDKLVGGSNSANVEKTDYNAFHLGGLIGDPDTNGNKVSLNIAGMKLEPRKLTHNATTGAPELNTFSYTDDGTMLKGGNIYGGCYASGYVNGGVVISISENAISDACTGSGVQYESIQNDVLASTLSVYGGGYGEETEIWGHTNINITGNGQIMKAYGGGEKGVVGKLKRDDGGNFLTKNVQEWYSETTNQDLHGYITPVTEYYSRNHSVAQFDEEFNATVTLNANILADDVLNVAKLYGGGFQGTVSGCTTVNLNRGRVYDAFGGASNADILGHTEMYVGKASAPQVTHNVYGANDFGGLIVGKNVFYVDNNKDGDHDDTMEKILCQTYVEYNSGNIVGDLFGGPCGAYEYTDPRYNSVIDYYTLAEYQVLTGNNELTAEAFEKIHPSLKQKPGFCRPQLLENLMLDPMLVPDPEGIREHIGYAANSFVNVISQSTLASDTIRNIFGAGQGMKGRIKSADERGSYVRLMSATKSQRTVKELSNRVYGAGYCSNTNRSLVDAYTGYYNTIFGGAHGITYEEVLDLIDDEGFYETNYMGYRAAVRLHEMDNNQMDIYGGGANAGAEETGVVLNGGQARNIYGASYAQGITYAASVEIPENSTSRVHAIFGGAEGGSDEFPCDAYNTFVTWKSADARVQDAIYGGNNAYRMTRNAYISVNAPVRNFEDQLTNVFGGGFGPQTVTLYTSVGLQNGAQVANVYGGGNNGQVLDTPSFRYYLDDGKIECADGTVKPEADHLKIYPTELLGKDIYGYQKYLNDSEVIGFHNWIVQHCWDGETLDSRNQPLGNYTANAHGHAHPVYFLSTQMEDMKNTNVYITKGALVAENAYGGGYGSQALVSGETAVHLWGGTIKGDIYGGGYGGHVEEYQHLIYPANGHELTMSSTHVELQGGIARNVYGGGLNGRVTGTTNVVLGTKDEHEFDFYGTTIDGQFEHQIVYGDPIVERSLYGGGQMGPVHGTAYLTLNQGHIGYKYDADQEATPGVGNAACYVENLDLNDEGDNLLDQNGNVFGAGYGEGATVDVTYVNIYGGTIRNSLYGGGEIAAVGQVERMLATGAHPQPGTILVPGRTHVYMYKGLVQGDVFGGGRGYSYDLTGNEVIGKIKFTDGYVFGTTDVEIRGGTIGTPATVADGHGNVFGGGNIGYCFTDAQKHGKKGDNDGEGRYYTNAWKCNECGYIDYMHDAPTVCGNERCKKSTTATDTEFQTTFTQVNADGTTTGVQNEKILSEDCRVVISPWAQVIDEKGIEIVGNNALQPDGSRLVTKTFKKGEYVPTAYLNLLKDKNTDKSQWDKLSPAGVTVRNAVFAGGNVSAGSDKVYANAYTVFGNATASVNDVFFRDLITLGTDHTGGLYGDGNLTFVDGYRELNITNFGTDYYGQQDKITKDVYDAMNDRERAYFELEYQATEAHTYSYYVCNEDHTVGGTTYTRGQHITVGTYEGFDSEEQKKWTSGQRSFDPTNDKDRIKSSEWNNMTAEEQAKWEEFGFCSIYAGRILNTIQRADFCGVFGSRLVIQGAQDRVPEVVDYTQYTINRVGEVSLNKKEYEGDKTGMSNDLKTHGNYFGLYNIVNYLGALTSDVDFSATRETTNENAGYKESAGGKPYGTASFYDWKTAYPNDRRRNNGTCHNTVALASGVYLEIVREPATSTPIIVTPNAEKDYGLITGIVQLDLINVMPGLGGGYVYAKNVHNARTGNPGEHDNLSVYNASAVNNSAYVYTGADQFIETSGNFIHPSKQIVDDCFPGGGDHNQPAHYWYIKGEIYVYDQYISAFTGSSTAYLENINLPLTITAGANGRLDLIDVKQNYYAYWKDEAKTAALGANETIVVNNITYGLNDVITWWEYMQLSDEQQKHFVKETYVAMKDYCTSETFDSDGEPINITTKGEVILPERYQQILEAGTMVYDPEDVTKDKDTGAPHMTQISLASVFHVSNAVSHENGYLLGVTLDNPIVWDNWYSPTSGPKKIDQNAYAKLTDGEKGSYLMGPTYYTDAGGVYGQYHRLADDIIAKSVVDVYPYSGYTTTQLDALAAENKKQAKVSPAYVAVTAADYDYAGQHKNMQAGVGISAEEYASLSAENKAKFSQAYTCVSTFDVDAASGEYIYFGELIPATQYQQFIDDYAELYKTQNVGVTDEEAQTEAEKHISDYFEQAYIVTEDGLYGGQQFTAGQNYSALKTWASLTAEDRQKFQFRYDALDALLLSNYPGTGEEGPGFSTAGGNDIALYDGPYWTGDNSDAKPLDQVYGAKQPIDYTATYNGTSDGKYLVDGKTYTRQEYEDLPNERRHYSAFRIEEKDAVDGVYPTYYIVREAFVKGGSNYKAGSIISPDVYSSLGDRQDKIQTFTPTAAGTYYICRENYTIGEKGEGQSVTNILPGGLTYTTGEVPTGIIINSTTYASLVNKQLEGFTIHGNSPIETSTFIVNRQSDINDLSKDRVVTLVYQYKYEESDQYGQVEEIIERHVLNIHITFKSGVPTIGPLQEPSIVLPGQTVGLKEPGVTPGAYEILGGGWEYFTNAEDAQKHQNGQTYVKGRTPMYWYQDGYYVAYFAKTYLGKTYSNSVQFKVANYHDISEVMADTDNYMFIDHPNVKRSSKIYIDNNINEKYTAKNGADGKSEIDMLYDLFDKSLEKPENLKTIKVDVQYEDQDGNPLYYQLEDGNPKKDVDADGKPLFTTTTPNPYPATYKKDQDVQTINDHARNCANLAFFLNDDVATTKAGGWTPIGSYDYEHPENGECFMGTLHGMGYTISGLDHSLFENLCGYVYNLGVTGSFTKSGVADRVSTGTVPDASPERKVHGHVNSSWIYTSAEPEDVSLASGNPAKLYYPVVGTPNNLLAGRDGEGKIIDQLAAVAGIHTINCYYPEGAGYPSSHTPNETANSATLRQFNNGDVTYNLNGFYLNKRYSDNALSETDKTNITGHTSPTTGDAAIYKYWTQDSEGNLEEIKTGYYAGGGSMHAYNGENLGYVERLFADGDFVYKYGTIPLKINERYSTTDSRYLPVWPDDYYFFGQQLSYGYDETMRPYQPLPSHTRKTISMDGSGKDNRLVTTEKNNIVYRLPAYFRSSEKRWVHLNPHAVFADHMKENYQLSAEDEARGLDENVLDGRKIHPGLTAIDFTGHNDFTFWTEEHKFLSGMTIDPKLVYSNGSRYISELQAYKDNIATYPNLTNLNDGAYFGPVTDYTTIIKFETHDLTQNLLTYAPTLRYSLGTANTLGVLQRYFTEPVFSSYYDNVQTGYRTVAALDESTISGIHGHLVQKENTTSDRHYYYAASDHFLVDKQDFNAPFEYEFNPAKDVTDYDYRMWYQRTPDNYAMQNTGWEGISLPFSAELVTTQDKGEITHFYNSALGAAYNAGKTSGHEYWLREFTGIASNDGAGTIEDPEIITAAMTYPVGDPARPTVITKEVTNTFLWDYYYSADGVDANGDIYKHEDSAIKQDEGRFYYGKTRTFEGYPLYEAGKPYIAGFPGGRYYEFDLSGTFVPQHSGTTTPDRLDAQTITFVSDTGITINVSDDELADAGMVEKNGYTFYANYLNIMASESADPNYNFYVLNAEGSSFDKTDAAKPVPAFRPFFTSSTVENANRPESRSITFGMGEQTQFEPDEETLESAAQHGLQIYAKKHKIIVESTLEAPQQVRIATTAGQVITTFTIEPGERIATPVQEGIYITNLKKLFVN